MISNQHFTYKNNIVIYPLAITANFAGLDSRKLSAKTNYAGI